MPQADPATQRALLELATLDTEVLQLQHRRTTLPELARLQQLRTEHQAISERVVAASTRVSDLEAQQARLESDLGPARDRLQRNQQRIDAGQVSDPKALRGMLDEVEHLKGRISDLEDSELELMQQLEDATTERDEAASHKTDIEATARDLMVERDTAFADLDAQVSSRQSIRADLARTLPQDLLGLYDKIAGRVGGAGAAELKDGRCTGCQLQLNPDDLRRFAAAAPNEVLRCEECSRILVRTEA